MPTNSRDNAGHGGSALRDLLIQFNNLQAKFEALLTKLDADAGVTDTNYETLLNHASAGGAQQIGSNGTVIAS